MVNLSELLEPIASQFRSLGIPEPITHWGHPCNDGDRGGGDGQFCRVYGMAGTFGG